MKLKKILVSQPKPESDKSPWFELPSKHKVDLDFKAFIHVEGLPAAEFRKQKIDISHYNCVILNSRNSVDHYFRMASELRYSVPEKTKYFCLTEAIALYLQKYIQYRKRKIFFAQQSLSELAEPIRKNKDEKFLFVCSDKASDKNSVYLDENNIQYTRAIFYRTVNSDMTDMSIPSYDMIVFFSPNGVNSLFDNFPNYKQTNTRIAVFGSTTYETAKSKGLKVDLAAPLPEAPSMTMALDKYIREYNAKNGKVEPMIPVFEKPAKINNTVEPVKEVKPSKSEKVKPAAKIKKVATKSTIKSKSEPAKKSPARKNTTKAVAKKTVKKKPVKKTVAKKAANKSVVKGKVVKKKPLLKAKPAKKSTSTRKAAPKKNVRTSKSAAGSKKRTSSVKSSVTKSKKTASRKSVKPKNAPVKRKTAAPKTKTVKRVSTLKKNTKTSAKKKR